MSWWRLLFSLLYHVHFHHAYTFREKLEFSLDYVVGIRGETIKYLLYQDVCWDKKKEVLVTISSFFVQERAEAVEVMSVPERSSHEGLQVLEFEYRIDSTRTGMQRILSTAFVSSKKLYLFNITLLTLLREQFLEEIVNSFDAAPVTWL